MDVESQQSLQLVQVGDLLKIFQRRKKLILIPAMLLFLAVTAIAFILPSIYQSTATILIEAQEIPQELVQSTVSGYIEERVQTITKIVLSRTNLQRIIKEFNLYPGLRDKFTLEELIDKMREDVIMEPIQTEVINPQSGRASTATIAFMLSYQGKQPRKVLDVTNTLVSLYLEENLRSRMEKTETAYAFLEKQLDDTRHRIEMIEEKLARFKELNLNALPELLELNLRNLDRTQKEIDARTLKIDSLRDRKVYLEGQLATIEPEQGLISSDGSRVMTAEEQYNYLRNEYLSLKATRSENHPEMRKLKNQLDVLEKDIVNKDDLATASGDLREKMMELEFARKKYSAGHPTVKKLEREVDALRAGLKTITGDEDYPVMTSSDQPKNPAYINVSTQIEATRLELESEIKGLAEANQKYEDYQKRIEEAPKVEQEYLLLQRDYANEQTKYQDTLARLQSAKEAKGLEEERISERMTLVDAPLYPEKPIKPKRFLIIVVGVVLAAGLGIGLGGLAEQMDKAVYNPVRLSNQLGIQVLAGIPRIYTAKEMASKAKERVNWIRSAILLVILALVMIHFLYEPLDFLWIKVHRKLGRMF